MKVGPGTDTVIEPEPDHLLMNLQLYHRMTGKTALLTFYEYMLGESGNLTEVSKGS